MECKNCNTVNGEDSKFCKSCGHSLNGTATADLGPNEHMRIGELIYAAYKYKESGDIEDAILACQGALTLNDASVQAHSLLASLYEQRGDIASAIHEYEKVLDLNPGSDADRRKLQDLKDGRMLLPKSTSTPGHFDSIMPYAPYLACVVVFFIVLTLGLTLGRPAQKSDQSAGTTTEAAPLQGTPQMTPTLQPYLQRQVPPGQQPPVPGDQQPVPGQVQQPQNPAATTLPQTNGTNGANRGITAPQQKPQTSKPAPVLNQLPPINPSKPQDQSPVITPVITPSDRTSTPPAPQPKPYTPPPAPKPRPSPPPAPSDPETRAFELQNGRRYQEAISAYREALGKTKDSGRIYQQIALCQQRLGQHDQAVDSYGRAINAYKSQMAAGRDPVEVQRNIRACEAGVQVSRSQAR